jgi:hypothetical protein
MGEREIVAVAFPVDVDLFLKIGMTVTDWHDERCDIEGCRVFIRGEGHAGSRFVHGLPVVNVDTTVMPGGPDAG